MKINPSATHNFGRKNIVINGSFDIWQRNTTFTIPANGAYTADRWLTGYDGTIGTFVASRQNFTLGQTAVPGEPTFFYRWNQTAAGSASTIRNIQQRIEGVRSLAGQTCTISFWATADTARIVTPEFLQIFGTGGSPSANVTITGTACNLTTSWQKFTQTFNIPSISGKVLGSSGNDYLAFYIKLPVNTTMTIDITQIQIELGSVGSNFEVKLPGEELRLCMRYYWKSFPQAVAVAQNAGLTGYIGLSQYLAGATSQCTGTISLPVCMRASPIFTSYNPSAANAQGRNISSATDVSALSITGTDASFNTSFTGAAGGGAGTTVAVHITADAEL